MPPRSPKPAVGFEQPYFFPSNEVAHTGHRGHGKQPQDSDAGKKSLELSSYRGACQLPGSP